MHPKPGFHLLSLGPPSRRQREEDGAPFRLERCKDLGTRTDSHGLMAQDGFPSGPVATKLAGPVVFSLVVVRSVLLEASSGAFVACAFTNFLYSARNSRSLHCVWDDNLLGRTYARRQQQRICPAQAMLTGLILSASARRTWLTKIMASSTFPAITRSTSPWTGSRIFCSPKALPCSPSSTTVEKRKKLE